MSSEKELNEEIERCQKRLEDYQLQMEALTIQGDLENENSQSQFDYLLRKISETIDEIEVLVSKIK